MGKLKKRIRGEARRKSTAKASITKRVVVRAAGKGVRVAAGLSMKTAGYVIKEEDGWVVEVDSDGNTKKVKKLTSPSSGLVLD